MLRCSWGLAARTRSMHGLQIFKDCLFESRIFLWVLGVLGIRAAAFVNVGESPKLLEEVTGELCNKLVQRPQSLLFSMGYGCRML